MNIPGSFIAGDTVTWDDDSQTDSLGNPILSNWTLSYYLRGPSTLDVVATPNGDGWTASITAAQSEALTPGLYTWLARVVLNGVKVTVGQGRVTVQADVQQQAAGVDNRSQAEQSLAAVDAEIASRVSGGAPIEYTIGNRHLRKESLSQLIMIQNNLRLDVAKERRAQAIAQGLGDPNSMYVRFVPVGGNINPYDTGFRS